MNEIKDLLAKAAIENLATQEVITNLAAAIDLLVAKVEDLEKKIES